ncbi:MAG: hypothetical protein JW751_29890 [Polyangiaceae bacterium]|nr:hypothetical protein [Polyangiaceae bacterium]
MVARWLGLFLVGTAVSCTATTSEPAAIPPAKAEPEASPELVAAARDSVLSLSDTLETYYATGEPSPRDLSWAYHRVKDVPVTTAGETYGKAKITARWVQSRGMLAASQLREVEALLLQSQELDANFRQGAAEFMLGVLYVHAPARLVEHGDSEVGLSLLEAHLAQHPDDPPKQLRLAEAYIALNDPDPAHPLLCSCQRRRAALSQSEQVLLDELLKRAGEQPCP